MTCHALGPRRDRLDVLPDKVLLQLFEAVKRCSKRDLCSVSRLNKRYHTLADAILYQTVHFLTPELHLIFSESLSRRPRRGSAIQDIKLAYPASELSSLVSDVPIHGARFDEKPARFDSLARTISAMSNLETLDVAVPEKLLHPIGQLFNGPFDLANLTTCTLFYQCADDAYWDLRENIHIFGHPTLETLVIRRAKLDYRGFDLPEQPHETALRRLHLIECDINDDALSDILMFPKALEEFVMTQAADPAPELEESSTSIRDYMSAIKSACHSLQSITVDFPQLTSTRALALRDFDALRTLRLNWDHQLFGKSSKKPRLHSVGMPPNLETLEFFNELGTDDEVTELFVYTLQTLDATCRKLQRLILCDHENGVPQEVLDACKPHERLQLDIIGALIRLDWDEEKDHDWKDP